MELKVDLNIRSYKFWGYAFILISIIFPYVVGPFLDIRGIWPTLILNIVILIFGVLTLIKQSKIHGIIIIILGILLTLFQFLGVLGGAFGSMV